MNAPPQTEIFYPESDGKAMGETDLHRDWMVRILEIMKQRYANQHVYTASDLLVYYEEGNPTKFIVPDNFVVFDCDPGRRRIFKTWVEKRVPDVIFEVTSRGTSSVDIIDKPVIYERMGVKEYFLYDPTAEYLNPALQGYRLNSERVLHEIQPIDGRLMCETLNMELFLRESDLVFIDADSGEEVLIRAEVEYHARQQERAARETAEARVRELETELRRLKGEA